MRKLLTLCVEPIIAKSAMSWARPTPEFRAPRARSSAYWAITPETMVSLSVSIIRISLLELTATTL
jgi:hypothetical protein